MSPFWGSLFGDLRGRGRNASLFIFVVPSLVGLAFFATAIPEEKYREYLFPAAGWVGLSAVVCLTIGFRKARACRRERLGRSVLSRDELNKARSKLVKQQDRKML